MAELPPARQVASATALSEIALSSYHYLMALEAFTSAPGPSDVDAPDRS